MSSNRSIRFINATGLAALLTISSASFGLDQRSTATEQRESNCKEILRKKPLPIELWCLEKVERGLFGDLSGCLANGQSTYIEERKIIAADQEKCRIKPNLEKIF